MNEKGFSLIECILVILLMGVIGLTAFKGNELLEQVRFECKVCEVIHEIEYAKNAAISTGGQYSVISYDHRIYVTHKGYQLKKIDLGNAMRIPNDITGHLINFKDSMAPGKAGTILIKNESLKKQARITVGVGTGMVRVYYETY